MKFTSNTGREFFFCKRMSAKAVYTLARVSLNLHEPLNSPAAPSVSARCIRYKDP